jgi:hypothetical protein
MSKQTLELLPQFERYSAWYNPCDRKVYQGKAPVERQAAIVETPDITAVDLKILLQEILGLQRPAYNLRNATRQINMNALKASIPVYTKLTAEEKVGELVEAPVKSGAWATLDFSLWKNVVHIVVSDEAQKRANVDIFGTQTRDAAGALTASENSQIKTVLEGGTTVAGANWGVSTNSPYTDLIGVMSTIAANGYPADFVAAHPLVWGNFFGNPFVKGQLAGAVYPDFTQGGGFPIIGLPGVTGFSDFALTNTIAIVGSKNNACVLGVGPTEAARYRNELGGYDAYIIRQYLQPQVAVSDAIRVLTGVR